MTNNNYNYYKDNVIIMTEVLILIFLNVYQSKTNQHEKTYHNFVVFNINNDHGLVTNR